MIDHFNFFDNIHLTNITNNFLSFWDNIHLTNITYSFYKPLPILFYLLIALATTQIPYLREYFSLINKSLNRSIQTIFRRRANRSKLKNLVITYAAYTGESLAAIGFFYLIETLHYQLLLYLFIGLIIVGIFLCFRTLWDILWALSFIMFLALPLYFGQIILIMNFSIFLTCSLLIQTMKNGLQVCKESLSEQQNLPGSGLLARLKSIPAILFGIMLLGQSLYVGYYILRFY
jgi:hypothetical protein